MKIKLINILFLSILTLQAEAAIGTNANSNNLKKRLRIGYWGSWKDKCGIAMYTEHIYNALKKSGYNVRVYSNNLPIKLFFRKIKKDKINILNIQYEPGLFHFGKNLVARNLKEFVELLKKIKNENIKIILTMHMEFPDSKYLLELADRCIYTRPPIYFKDKSKSNIIPIGVPVYETNLNKKKLRKKYGFDLNDKIISTTGFMLIPKEFGKTINELGPLIKKNPNYKIQLLTSFTDRSDYLIKQSKTEYDNIKKAIKLNNIENQVIHITKFLPQKELNERLFISDIGFLWGDESLNASSASIKEFIASRLPLIVNDSPRYLNDSIPGILKTPNNKSIFAQNIIETLNDDAKLQRMKTELEKSYKMLNNDEIIKEHLKVLAKI